VAGHRAAICIVVVRRLRAPKLLCRAHASARLRSDAVDVTSLPGSGVPLAGLALRDVHKSFGATSILDGVSLDIGPQEFIAFLGPSGSGKSTLLRIIAGLETADSGEIMLGNRRIDGLAPGKRDVAMVFQHYALYPHMSVRDNMAFGLRNARVPEADITALVDEAARSLEITELLDRKPAQLSGGQRQRVAIGRAIVKRPKVFLLDEPLSNLDAALRTRTRVELAQLRQRVEAAIIMVTHDQAEAMTLADRIIVMNDRRIQQIGTPMEIYDRPANAFVARFVGSPAMSMVPARLAPDSGAQVTVVLGDGSQVETTVSGDSLPPAGEFMLGVRPENVTVVDGLAGSIDATVELVERLGERSLVYARLGDGSALTAQDEGNSRVQIGDRIALRIDGSAAHLFDGDGVAYHARAAV
jgi:multiple sugar transport system ATP-binding protein